MAAAKHRAIDHFRRHKMLERKHQELGHELETQQESIPDFDAAFDDDVGDDMLQSDLHRVPSRVVHRGAGRADAAAARRTDHRGNRPCVPGLPSRRSRSGSSAPSGRWPTRTCRSKCRAAPSSPDGCRRSSRSIYLIFNEGYSATAGDDWMRPGLCEDALASGPDPRRARAGRAGSARARRVDGDPGVASRGPDPSKRRADPAARSGSRTMGSAAHSSRTRGARSAPSAWVLRADRMCCRRRSPRVMLAHASRRRRTGRASCRYTASSLG